MLNQAPGAEIGVPYLVVNSGQWMKAQALACDSFFPLPKSLRLLAVTGTNGKTTTADLALQLGEQSGLKGMSIGTLGVRSQGKTQEEFGLTTPGYIQLRSILNNYGSDKDFCVMEASSHAIAQDRIHGLHFQAAAWTSFSQDHLDYHGTMEKYLEAKMKIVDYLNASADLFIPHRQKELAQKLMALKQLKPTEEIDPVIKKRLPPFFSAQFNLENLECAIHLIRSLNIELDKARWSELLPPPGRFFVQEWQGRMAVVDFAHTPDALDNICRSIRMSFPGRKLVVLFGCGGDRDRTKRPLMGQAAARWADKIVLTSDNPRSEDPQQIIEDIAHGIKNFSGLVIEAERPLAAQKALTELGPGEILLMAGKGHEDYIQIGQKKIPYSDSGEIEKFIRGNAHG
jgi:UDP-N-acetylmuramoyl-L-alanyl-D-glutamate--2,6-diaminopimelate ligase